VIGNKTRQASRGLLGNAAEGAIARAKHDERIRIELVSVAGLSVHAAAEVLNKRGATTPSGVGQWHPTTVARLRSRLRITDTFGLIRDDLIAALNDEPDFVTGKLIDFICHIALELRAWNNTIAIGGQRNKANAEYHRGLCQQLENALLALQARCGGMLDVARTVAGLSRGAAETQVEPLRREPAKPKRSP
jgi:hypothetical protein